MNAADRRRANYLLFAALAASLAALVVCPFLGLIEVKPSQIFTAGDRAALVFWSLRVPRVAAAFVAGAALAVAGMVFQAMFRNVLATPYTLGVASGAAFGASLAYKLGLTFSLVLLDAPALLALGGAMATVALVWFLASPSRGFSTVTMLLAGVIVSFFFSSLVLLVQYLSDFSEVFQITRWLMGSLDTVGPEALRAVAPLLLAGLLLIGLLCRELDLLTLGDELASSRGLNAMQVRVLLFTGASLLVAGVVSVCGPIGFVGLIIPAIGRSLFRALNHRRLFWLVLLMGGAFLTVCDSVARLVTAPAEIPVGVITALLGGPFFLWLLVRKKDT